MRSSLRLAQSVGVASVLSLAAAGGALANSEAEADGQRPVTTAPAPEQNEGLVPKRLVWPGVVVIVVIAVIVTAAVTGPLIRANSDDAEQASNSEPPE